GQDLATIFRRTGRFPSERVIEIGRQLCDGLATAHAHGILHRALEPSNVLVNENGSVLMTELGFGIADEDTGDGRPIGAPEYLAPEQLMPGRLVSEKTDL